MADDRSRSAADRWLAETPKDVALMSLKAQQVMLVLDHLINALVDGHGVTHDKLASMDEQYNLSGTTNVEIGFRPTFLSRTESLGSPPQPAVPGGACSGAAASGLDAWRPRSASLAAMGEACT